MKITAYALWLRNFSQNDLFRMYELLLCVALQLAVV